MVFRNWKLSRDARALLQMCTNLCDEQPKTNVYLPVNVVIVAAAAVNENMYQSLRAWINMPSPLMDFIGKTIRAPTAHTPDPCSMRLHGIFNGNYKLKCIITARNKRHMNNNNLCNNAWMGMAYDGILFVINSTGYLFFLFCIFRSFVCHCCCDFQLNSEFFPNESIVILNWFLFSACINNASGISTKSLNSLIWLFGRCFALINCASFLWDVGLKNHLTFDWVSCDLCQSKYIGFFRQSNNQQTDLKSNRILCIPQHLVCQQIRMPNP